jgi:hypothetical protein
MAVFGWKDIKQAERYTRRAEQKKLAAGGMHAINKTRSSVSNFEVHAQKVGHKSEKCSLKQRHL